MCVGERKKWPCCVCGELGYGILLICLTPGRKPAARLWTGSRMSVSSWLSLSLSITTVSAGFSSCCSSCSAARYAVTGFLLSWIYWHCESRLQGWRKTSKYLKLSFYGLVGTLTGTQPEVFVPLNELEPSLLVFIPQIVNRKGPAQSRCVRCLRRTVAWKSPFSLWLL